MAYGDDSIDLAFGAQPGRLSIHCSNRIGNNKRVQVAWEDQRGQV